MGNSAQYTVINAGCDRNALPPLLVRDTQAAINFQVWRGLGAKWYRR